MYLERYNLKAPPFGPDPDADFYFQSDRHAEARQYIDQVLWHDEAFVAITGDKGTGKTIFLQHLIDEMQGELPLISLEPAPENELDFLRSLMAALGFDEIGAEREEYRNILSAFLLHQQRQGNQPILAIDEVERIPNSVLEEIRWLASIAEDGPAPLHFLLFGRVEFQERLMQRELRDLGDRIRVRHQLRGLSEGETLSYINHRLGLVGGGSSGLLPDQLIPVIYRYTDGVPGRINELCHTALLKAAAGGCDRVDMKTLETVIEMLRLKPCTARDKPGPSQSLGAFKREDVAKLVVSHNGRLVSWARLDKDRFLIGRHNLNDLCLDSNAVSRCHAHIVETEGTYVLLDLNSTNGTFVNFKRIQQHLLRDNDIVAIGMHRLKFIDRLRQAGGDRTRPSVTSPTETVVLDAEPVKRVNVAIKRVR